MKPIKPIKYTKEYGAPIPDIAKCWFCDSAITPYFCNNKQCQEFEVYYFYYEKHSSNVTFELRTAQFRYIINSKDYLINYQPLVKKLEVLVRLKPPEDPDLDTKNKLQEIFSIPCESIILTPQNVKSKLPTLLTFL